MGIFLSALNHMLAYTFQFLIDSMRSDYIRLQTVPQGMDQGTNRTILKESIGERGTLGHMLTATLIQ